MFFVELFLLVGGCFLLGIVASFIGTLLKRK